jgi:ubiquinone/menaquinone biosynthesis C-methylase UbiE
MLDTNNPITDAPQIRDPHRFINELSSDALERLVQRLENRGKDTVFTRLLDNYLAHLPLTGAPTVLEVGCGTGVVTRAVAARPDFNGLVVGADQSAELLAHARIFAVDAALANQLIYDKEDAHALSYPDGTFDIAIAHTLISHVTDPGVVLQELARVTKPGGMVVVFDGDYASLTYAYDDEPFGRRMDYALAAATFNNRIVMRTLPHLMTAAGLSIEQNIAEVVSEIGAGSFFRSFAETYAPNVKTSHLLPDTDVDTWLNAQVKAMEENTFFASCNYYTYIARR